MQGAAKALPIMSLSFSGSSQEVRMVWLLNMLTDVCKPQPAGDTSTNWCDKDKLDRGPGVVLAADRAKSTDEQETVTE